MRIVCGLDFRRMPKTIQTRMYMAEYDRVLQQALGGGLMVSSLHCKTGRDRTSFTVALDKAVKAVSDKRSYDVRVMQNVATEIGHSDVKVEYKDGQYQVKGLPGGEGDTQTFDTVEAFYQTLKRLSPSGNPQEAGVSSSKPIPDEDMRKIIIKSEDSEPFVSEDDMFEVGRLHAQEMVKELAFNVKTQGFIGAKGGGWGAEATLAFMVDHMIQSYEKMEERDSKDEEYYTFAQWLRESEFSALTKKVGT